MAHEGIEFEPVIYHFGTITSHFLPQVKIPVTPQLFFSWVVWIIIIALSVMVARKAKLVPTGMQVVFEALIEFVTNLADEMIGPRAKSFYPLFIGLFFFILISNLIGFVPGLVSPTSDPNLTFGLALFVFGYFVFLGFKHNGIGYLKQFKPPKLPLIMFPVALVIMLTEIISFFIRPCSLGLRLFCNIFSKELFLGILAALLLQFFLKGTMVDYLFSGALLVMRPAIMLMGLIIAFIQALVFMILSMSYIAGAVHMEEH